MCFRYCLEYPKPPRNSNHSTCVVMSSTNNSTSKATSRGLSAIHWGLVMLMTASVTQAADQRFCGKQLVAMLSMLCDEFPDLHYGVKKSVIDFDKTDYPVDVEGWGVMYNQDPDTVNSNDIIIPTNHVTAQEEPIWMSMMYPQSYGFRTANGRNDLIPSRFRKSPRGIVDECCLRPCGMKQLLKYCKTVA
ncbi:uncharacterized protein LOC131436746 isoform X1 [Malaya genurostris]|uniref:uncharacterized protein LOC131436746 isoform X1 n=1 Tax=Malaya genurostris TaxID=325434 RepID=UPI0026F3F5B4|nr:uncharacterized protein LOC131436746 isoform X1 [Malaya genurostris]